MTAPLPVPGFTLAAASMEALLDQFQAIIDDTHRDPTGKRGVGVPLYGVGPGFVACRDGRRLDLKAAVDLFSEHVKTAQDPASPPNIARFAERCAAELRETMILSLASTEAAA